MKRKTNNHTIVPENNDTNLNNENSVKQLFIGEYFNIHTFKKHPITNNFILQEAKALKTWADQEDSLRISDFYDRQGYSPEMYHYWIDKFPEMSHANQYALRRIGSRRENGAMQRKFAESTIHKVQGYYDQIWRNEVRLANEARLAIADKVESRVVVIERFPSSSQNEIEVISTSKITPEELAANIHRNTATDRQVKVNANVGDSYE